MEYYSAFKGNELLIHNTDNTQYIVEIIEINVIVVTQMYNFIKIHHNEYLKWTHFICINKVEY